MPSFGVTPKKEEELRTRMERIGVRETDLQERFITGGGPGGQKVNRSATCVYLLHRPSGTEVKMQQARSQALNRYYARRRLCELLEEARLGAQSPASLRLEKLRKQKQRRRRRSRNQALEPVPRQGEEDS